MKKLFALAIAAILALAGCAPVPAGTTPTPAQLLAQINTQVCPFVQASLDVVPQLTGLSADVVKAANDAAGKAATVCKAAAQASITASTAPSLQDLADNALPAVLAALMAVPNPDPAVIAAKNGIIIAKAFLPAIVAQFKAVAPVATPAVVAP